MTSGVSTFSALAPTRAELQVASNDAPILAHTDVQNQVFSDAGLFGDIDAEAEGLDWLTRSQYAALKTIERDGGYFLLTGAAGTGKSKLTQLLLTRAQERGEHTVTMASTGVAALNIGGVTVHRASRCYPTQNKFADDAAIRALVKSQNQCNCAPIAPVFELADFIVIDEISMLRFDVAEFVLSQIQRSWRGSRGKKTLVFVGDFYQLPPVVTADDRLALKLVWSSEYENSSCFAFQAPRWQAAGVRTLELTEAVRQHDADFIEALGRVRKGDYEAAQWIYQHSSPTPLAHGVNIYPRNAPADRCNSSLLAKLKGELFVHDAVLTGSAKDSDVLGTPHFEFKIGARVVATVNEASGEGYCNGSAGTIVDYHEAGNKITVLFDDVGERTVELLKRKVNSFDNEGRLKAVGTVEQYPLKLGWAITIHKSQGQTFDAVNIDASCFEAGQLYTALSRVRSLEGLHLRTLIVPSALRVSQDVRSYFEDVV